MEDSIWLVEDEVVDRAHIGQRFVAELMIVSHRLEVLLMCPSRDSREFLILVLHAEERIYQVSSCQLSLTHLSYVLAVCLACRQIVDVRLGGVFLKLTVFFQNIR